MLNAPFCGVLDIDMININLSINSLCSYLLTYTSKKITKVQMLFSLPPTIKTQK